LIIRLTEPPQQGTFGRSLANVGDVNGDGRNDLAAGDEFGERFVVMSILDAQVILDVSRTGHRSFGEYLAPAGDFDQDGVPDILVGAPDDSRHEEFAGSVWVISGADGSTLLCIEGGREDFIGEDVSSADVNRDGIEDFVFGAQFDEESGEVDGGMVRVISGRTAITLYHFAGPPTEGIFTSDIDLGDMDGDALPDFLLADHRSDRNGTDSGHVVANRASDIYLDCAPHRPVPNATLGMIVGEGSPGNLVGIFLIAIDGSSTFIPVVLGAFDAAGLFGIGGKVPSGLSGIEITLRAYAIGAAGKLVETPDETIEFQ
jgi:hypothetical protein